VSAPRKLNPDEALADALAAYGDRNDGERFMEVRFGVYSSSVEHVGGGAWWRLSLIRSVSDEAERQPVVSERAARLEIVRTWREWFHPDPEPVVVPRTTEPT
jgi:hypothetical protein